MNNIPIFPDFRKINLIKEKDIRFYTDNFLPYSDYNYISMYTYGLGATRVSILNDNLVALFEDYIDEKLFFSFIGLNNINDTVNILLQEAHNKGISTELKLIPEVSVKDLDNTKFEVISDESSYDYILSSDKIYNYIGNNLRNKKNLLHRFTKNYTDVDIRYEINKDQIMLLFDIWSDAKYESSIDGDIEKIAILNLLNSKELNYNYVGLTINNKLVSFFVYEIVNDYCILHFIKYDTDYIGICSFTYKLLAEKALDNNCKYINIEQDLGIDGLRKAKKQLCPIDYLKKYIIRKYDKWYY